MTEKLKELAGKIKRDKKLFFIVCLGIAGILLLLFSEIFSSGKSVKNAEQPDIYEIQNQTEKSIEKLLQTVDGVGKVKVCVSIDSMEEKVMAKNSESDTGEGKQKNREEYVLIKEGGAETGLTLRIITPGIRGIAVSCEGGGSEYIRSEVIRLLSALCGINKNRIWVSKMCG